MPDNAKTMSDDELNDLARSLREGAGRELREEASEAERLTEHQRRRRAGLGDTARAAMHRGDAVTVTVSGLTLAYPVAGVGSDYLVMEDAGTIVDVRLDRANLALRPRASGGSTGRPAAATFRARLAEHEQDESEVRVVTSDRDETAGTIEVVAVDHIVVTGDEALATVIPVEMVAVVFSRSRPRWR